MDNCRVLSKGVAITQKFKSLTHKGIDLTGEDEKGNHVVCEVLAHSDGVVKELVTTCNKTYKTGSSYGNYVLIDHGKGFMTLYAHLKYGSVKLKKGQKVSKGEAVGIMGNTGHSTGAHLHFEVRLDGTKINPEPYLNADLKKKIDLTGVWDVETTKATQRYFGTTVDGTISNQSKYNKTYLISISTKTWKFGGSGGSSMVKAIQKLVGSGVDGQCGKATIIKMQTYLKSIGLYKGEIDGKMGKQTVTAWQMFLNR